MPTTRTHACVDDVTLSRRRLEKPFGIFGILFLFNIFSQQRFLSFGTAAWPRWRQHARLSLFVAGGLAPYGDNDVVVVLAAVGLSCVCVTIYMEHTDGRGCDAVAEDVAAALAAASVNLVSPSSSSSAAPSARYRAIPE